MQEMYRPGDVVLFHSDNHVIKGKIFLTHNDFFGDGRPAFDLFIKTDPDFPDGVIYKRVPQKAVIERSADSTEI